MSELSAKLRNLGWYACDELECEAVADELERLTDEVRQYKEAYKIAYEATFQGHLAHWDTKGTHGANCPECIAAREAREKCEKILATATQQDKSK